MKKTLFTILIAFSIGSLTLAAQSRLEQRYIIDGKVVEDFNGSQLEGQEIVTYKTDITEEGGVAYKNHIITTKQYVTKTVVISKKEPRNMDDSRLQVFVVDGKIVTKYEFNNLNYYDIERMDVINGYRTENELIKKYSTDGRDVVMVTLKKEKSKRYKALGEVGHFTNKKEEGTNK